MRINAIANWKLEAILHNTVTCVLSDWRVAHYNIRSFMYFSTDKKNPPLEFSKVKGVIN